MSDSSEMLVPGILQSPKPIDLISSIKVMQAEVSQTFWTCASERELMAEKPLKPSVEVHPSRCELLAMVISSDVAHSSAFTMAANAKMITTSGDDHSIA
ncbi:hypothetical protein PRNP1_011173 [Phytophthora ramorum]